MFSFKRLNLISLLLLVAGTGMILCDKGSAQESPSSVRQRFTIFPTSRPCDPAQVKGISLGRQPLEAILAQVTVENLSEKTIVGVKLRWNVYEQQEGRRVSLASCLPNSPSAEVLLTGATDIIQLTSLNPKETTAIGINPLPVPTSASNTAFVDRPLVMVDAVKSVAVGSTGKYALVVFVSEVEFKDGTRWTRTADWH
jgi:hypothetical protein